jgi:hypothetical protein
MGTLIVLDPTGLSDGTALTTTNIPANTVTVGSSTLTVYVDTQSPARTWYRFQNPSGSNGQFRKWVTASKVQSFRARFRVEGTLTAPRLILGPRYGTAGTGGSGNAFRVALSTARQITIALGATPFTIFGTTTISGGLPAGDYELVMDYVVDTATTGAYSLKVCQPGTNTVVAGSTLTSTTANLGVDLIVAYDIGSNDTAATAIDLRYTYIQMENDRTLSSGVPTSLPVYNPVSAPVTGYTLIGGLIQSNVRGPNTANQADPTFDATDAYPSNVYEFRGSGLGTARTIQPAAEPLYSEDTTNGMGVLNRFVKSYATDHPDEKVLIVMMARGGTGVSTPDSNGNSLTWQVDATDSGTATSNNLYAVAKRTWTAALTAAGAGSKVAALIANHGSTDGSNNLDPATYRTRLLAFIDGFRAHVGANTPYLMMTMRDNLFSETRHKQLDDVQNEIPTLRQFVRKAPSPVGTQYYKSTDTVHFNAVGARIIGTNLYSAFTTSATTVVNAGADVTVEAGAQFILTGTESGDTVSTRSWIESGGTTTSGATRTQSAPITLGGLTKTYTYSVVFAGSATPVTDTVTVTVLPATRRVKINGSMVPVAQRAKLGSGSAGGGGTTASVPLVGLRGWWKADAIASPPANGGNMVSWTDSAGTYPFLIVDGNPPVYRSSGTFLPNTKPCVEFTASNSQDMGSTVPNNTATTKVLVFRLKTLPATGMIGLYGNAGGLQVSVTSTGKVALMLSGQYGLITGGTATLAVDTWYVVTATSDGATSHVTYVNGVQDATSSTAATFTALSATLGSPGTGGDFLNGYIAEALDYSRVLTSTEITAVTSSLSNKYGLSTAPVAAAGINRSFDFDTSEDQAVLSHPSSGFQINSAHQKAWLTTPTRLGTGHSERFEIHNSTGDIVNGQAYRSMMDVVDTNDGGDTGNGATGYSDVYWCFSSYIPVGADANATVSTGFSQVALPEYTHLMELHERGWVNGSTAGVNNINEVSNLAIMIRNSQLQFRGRCGTWTWNGTSWDKPVWSTTTPGTTGSNDQIPIPIVKPGGTNATMPTNVWVDIILHVSFSKTSTGLVEVWARQAGQAFTTSPNLTINGPTHKVLVGSSGTRTSADYEASSGTSGCYMHCGLYAGTTSWGDTTNSANVHIIDEVRRYGTVTEAKANWGDSAPTSGWWSADLSNVPVGSMGASRDSGTATALELRKQWDYWDQTGGTVIAPSTDGLTNPPLGKNLIVKWQKPAGTTVGVADQVYQKLNRTFTSANWPLGSAAPVAVSGSPANMSGRYVTYRWIPSGDWVLNPAHGWFSIMSFKENYRDSGGGFHQDGTGWKVGGDNFSGAAGPLRFRMTSKVSFLLSDYMDRWVKFEYRLYQGSDDKTGHGGRIELWADNVLLDTGYEGDPVDGTPSPTGHIGSANFVPLAQTEGMIWVVGQYTSNQTTNGTPDYVNTHTTSYVGPSYIAPL